MSASPSTTRVSASRLIDELGATVPDDLALLLFVSLVADREASGRLAVPVTTTQLVEEIARDTGLDVTRTEVSLAALTQAATDEDVVFAGTAQGRFIFPHLLPAPAASASVANLLDLLALRDEPLSSLVSELPRPNVVHRAIHCPWSMKGAVMRVLTEHAKGRPTDVLDGIKVFENGGWAQAIPDPYEPLVHLYAEAETPDRARELEEDFRTVIESVVAGPTDTTPRAPLEAAEPQVKLEG